MSDVYHTDVVASSSQYPKYIVLDTAKQIRNIKICLLDIYENDRLVMSKIETSLSILIQNLIIKRDVSNEVRFIINEFVIDINRYHKQSVRNIESLITVEQGLLDIVDAVETARIDKSMLVYHYSGLTSDGRLVLKKYDDYQDFHDDVCMAGM